MKLYAAALFAIKVVGFGTQARTIAWWATARNQYEAQGLAIEASKKRFRRRMDGQSIKLM